MEHADGEELWQAVRHGAKGQNGTESQDSWFIHIFSVRPFARRDDHADDVVICEQR